MFRSVRPVHLGSVVLPAFNSSGGQIVGSTVMVVAAHIYDLITFYLLAKVPRSDQRSLLW